MKKWLLGFGVAAWMMLAATAEAHGFVGIGINFGIPVYRPCPWYGPCYGPCYRPYVYVAPPPVYVAPAPVVYQPAPVYVPQTAPVVQPATVPVVQPAPRTTSYNEPPAQSWSPASGQADVNRYVQQLFDQQERVRSEAAIELGRMRAERAVEPLSTLLSTDKSPLVRETAARALGLIASPRSLTALQQAAQADDDRDVRHSAQFAAEVIRANMRRD